MSSAQAVAYSPEPVLAPSAIMNMPTVLTWRDGQSFLEHVHASWVALLAAALKRTVREITDCYPSAGKELTTNIDLLSDYGFERFLLAPETVFHLLPDRPATLEQKKHFLCRSVRAELSGGISQNEELWTALGDKRIDTTGKVTEGPRLAEFMPLDFDSPYSRCIDLTGVNYTVPEPRPPLEAQKVTDTLEKLSQVRDKLRTVKPELLAFVVRFTKVLIVQEDHAEPFSSGSNGDYVGRTVISNPDEAAEADLADAIVHEAIHSLLYMQEEQQPWIFHPNLFEPTPRVVSPWSGRKLPLRPYLQACFVWYGLLNLWASACQKKVFETERSHFLFKRAAVGFLGESLSARVADYRSEISSDVLGSIDEMQRLVVSALPQ